MGEGRTYLKSGEVIRRTLYPYTRAELLPRKYRKRAGYTSRGEAEVGGERRSEREIYILYVRMEFLVGSLFQLHFFALFTA